MRKIAPESEPQLELPATQGLGRYRGHADAVGAVTIDSIAGRAVELTFGSIWARDWLHWEADL